MKIIELQPIKEWEEKENNSPTGNLRLYIGQLHIGTCVRKNKSEDLYSFHSLFDIVTKGMNTYSYQPLESLKMDVEYCFKEHAVKFIKSLRTLTKVTDVKQSPPSKRFHSPLKKDGNGKK